MGVQFPSLALIYKKEFAILVAISKLPQNVAKPETAPFVFPDSSLVANRIGIKIIRRREQITNNKVSDWTRLTIDIPPKSSKVVYNN